MGAEPARRAERARDVHAAARADRLREGEALGDGGDVLLPGVRVGVEQVDPAPDLGDHDVVPGEGLDRRADALAVVEPDRRAVGRPVALRAVGPREGLGVVAGHRDGGAEADPRAGRGRRLGGARGGGAGQGHPGGGQEGAAIERWCHLGSPAMPARCRRPHSTREPGGRLERSCLCRFSGRAVCSDWSGWPLSLAWPGRPGPRPARSPRSPRPLPWSKALRRRPSRRPRPRSRWTRTPRWRSGSASAARSARPPASGSCTGSGPTSARTTGRR